MSNNIDIKTLEAFQDGNHKAFETVFIAYYNKTKAFIDGYIKSESDAEELTEDLFVNLWINHDSIDASKSFSSYLHTIARKDVYKRQEMFRLSVNPVLKSPGCTRQTLI